MTTTIPPSNPGLAGSSHMRISNLPCYICERPASIRSEPGIDRETVDCAHCGTYDITGTAIAICKAKPKVAREAALTKAKRWAAQENANTQATVDSRCF